MGRQGTGFSLIEVMVALVILTVGLIGVFNLHLVAKQGSYESFQQTLAAHYAADIVSRMRLNSSELSQYGGNYQGGLVMPAKSCDANNRCLNAETRVWDLYQWEQQFRGGAEVSASRQLGGLDNATGCIQIGTNGDVSVVMSWRGIRSISDGAANANAFVRQCGSADKRRRIYLLETVIQ
ncbi:type IV pilus modification protein PilV [Shewanella sp. NFH-SH190041]|uniref:type IV pilus modification protein PilV n=1 Tax=Shewanella sp. NFH-SH190041 TaxID=2950245 RepID=UPI0021C2F9EE|nr:type IV pilus modification protein PilV [Shewanella sp. NFH-SH190041]BDM63676.1 type IV pilus modification protein PilV [Shewanella sp. NFH-SH190041]